MSADAGESPPPRHRFIRLFNILDERIREIAGLDRSDASFSDVVRRASTRDKRVNREREWLTSVARWRNTLVHDPWWEEGSDYVVEPTEATLDRLETLIASLEAETRTVWDVSARDVCTFEQADSLAEVLRYMGSNDYSQVIIGTQEGLTLLTADGIARWFEINLSEDDGILMVGSVVGDALEHDLPNRHLVWPRERSVHEAREAFAESPAKGFPRLYGIVVTQMGRREESPLGIVTPWDLFDLD